MIVPIVLALPALFACTALGLACERMLGWQVHGASRWSTRVLAGMAALLALALHPIALAVFMALALIERRFGRGLHTVAAAEPSKNALIVLVLFSVIACVRPAAPLFWDEHVWLSKVRLAGSFGLSLRALALDPRADIVPLGYPILGSMAEVWFALGRADTTSLVAGATAFVLVSLAAAVFSMPEQRRISWALALATAPLVWIHLRSAHLDLAVGFLALCFAMSLARVRARERVLPIAMSSGFLLSGMKDEGLLHVLAIGVAHVFSSDERARAWRESALATAPALVAALTWRILVWMHGVSIADHALEGVGILQVGAIASELVRALTDIRSWGFAWVIAVGAMGVSVCLRQSASARSLSLALTFCMLALMAGLVLGGERLVGFVLTGTVANRLLLQLAPLAALATVEALSSLRPGLRALPQKSGG